MELMTHYAELLISRYASSSEMIRGYKRQIFVFTRTTVPFEQGYAALLRFVVTHQSVALILEQL